MQHKLNCLECKKEFDARRSDAKFCSPECRYIFWFQKDELPNKKYKTIYDLRKLIEDHHKQGQQIIRHQARILKDYSDWENRLLVIENLVEKKEIEAGVKLPELEIEIQLQTQRTKEYDALNDLFDDAPSKNTPEDDDEFRLEEI